jgi:hypothetical protein
LRDGGAAVGFTTGEFYYLGKFMAKVKSKAGTLARPKIQGRYKHGEARHPFMAQVLLDALYLSDDKSIERHGITKRTLQGFRRQAIEDEKFAQFFATKRKEFEANWIQHTTPVLVNSLAFLNRAAKQADDRLLKNPLFVEAMTDAFRTVAEVQITANILDAQIEASKVEASSDEDE